MTAEPIDLPVDVTVHFIDRPAQPVTSPKSPSARLTVPTTPHHLLSLSPTQSAVRDLVNLFNQATSSQVRRAIYSGTPRGVIARSSRHLKALSERGVIKRLPYKLSGYQRGSGEFVHAPVDSKARIPNLHTLDITEVYVKLLNSTSDSMSYFPEPWSHDTWGGVQLKPDFYVRIGGRHFFGECDRSTEYASALSAQMNAYVRAFNGMDGGSFPQVLFICHDKERASFIQREVNRKTPRELFRVILFDDVVTTILGVK